jgi:hypothetical protein
MTHSVEMVEWEIVLEAPPVKAWRALIEPELRGRWLQDSRFTFTLAPLDRDRTRVRLHHVGLGFDGVEYRVGWYGLSGRALSGDCGATGRPEQLIRERGLVQKQEPPSAGLRGFLSCCCVRLILWLAYNGGDTTCVMPAEPRCGGVTMGVTEHVRFL